MAIDAESPTRPDRTAPVERAVHVVTHTHWDREWYLSFESFRARLCRLMDSVLDACDRDAEYTFMPDGQVAMVDDYLAVRPDAADRLRACVRRGALTLGPWYTLGDQFLVSGETTLRNLQMGTRRTRELGGRPLRVVYCPDQFGQIAQMPQVAALVDADGEVRASVEAPGEGIRRAVAMRGVPAAMEAARFLWVGLDGTAVDTVHLRSGYYQLGLLDDPEAFATWLAAAGPGAGRSVLLLSGDDHRTATALPAHVVAAQGRFSTLERYWDELAPPVDLPVLHGELRHAGRESLTTNVVSNRVDLRLATARAELERERYAEPLAAFALDRQPSERLALSWRHAILNAAHDTICATSADAVVTEALARARASEDIAAGVTQEALDRLASRMRHPGLYVWNPSPFERTEFLAAHRRAQVLRGWRVPGLGWARVDEPPVADPCPTAPPPPMRVLDQVDRGDTYNEDCDPDADDVTAAIAPAVTARPGEPFLRLRVAWVNRKDGHRVRLHLTLPRPAATLWTDTPFGALQRPAQPEVRWGKDRVSGYPAARFVVAGGLCLLVDRTTEVELVPETQELAVTLLRSVRTLSGGNLRTRPYPAGPGLVTWGTRLLGEVAWDLAVMPWDDEARLPWAEWEQFALPMPLMVATGGGDLPERGTAYPELPQGNLSAVLPDAVRVFDAGPPWRIRTRLIRPRLPV